MAHLLLSASTNSNFHRLNFAAEFALACALIGLFIVIPTFSITYGAINSSLGPSVTFLFGVTIVAGLLGLASIFGMSFYCQLSRLDVSLLLFLLYSTVSRYSSSIIPFSLNYHELLALSILYTAIRNVSSSYHGFIVAAALVSGVLQAFKGLYQLHSGVSNNNFFSITGDFANPGPFSGYLAGIVIMAVAIRVTKCKMFKELFLARNGLTLPEKVLTTLCHLLTTVCVVAVALVLPVTASRAALIGILTAMAFIIYKTYYHNLQSILSGIKRVYIWAFFAFVCTMAMLSIYYLKKDSADGRLLIWRVTSRLVADNPMFGCGYDNFKSYYMTYQSTYFSDFPRSKLSIFADNVVYAFNEPLEILATLGLLGTLIGCMVIYSAFTRSGTAKSDLVLVARSALICVGGFALFSYPSHVLPIKMLVVLSLAIISASTAQPISVRLNWWKSTSMRTLVAFILFAICLLNWTLVRQLHNAYKQYSAANSLLSSRSFSRAVAVFASVKPLLSSDGTFMALYGKSLLLSGRSKEAIDVLENASKFLGSSQIELDLADSHLRNKNFASSKMHCIRAINMTPNRIFPRYKLAEIYQTFGHFDDAKEIAAQTLKMKSKVENKMEEEIVNKLLRIVRTEH
jgi:O-antigen ligase